MKFLLLTTIVVAVTASNDLTGDKWRHFKLQHGKSYLNQVEELKRFAIFQDNLRQIEEHNALYTQGLTSYKLGVNQFADMSHEEFKSMLTYQKSSKPKRLGQKYFQHQEGVSVPESFDWREKGAVTGIKNQRSCGSCWAFSAIGATETAYYLSTNKLVSFSEQQLVDCTENNQYGNLGCSGGQMDPAFQYIIDEGIQAEGDYPYKANDDVCNANGTYITKLSSYVDILQRDEVAIREAVATVGTVSVAIDASFLQLYESGVYVNYICTPDELNHGVLIVGYGSENGTDYWVVKNSWGLEFGEDGYIRMQRGVNQCGIAEDPSYPVM